MTTVSRWMVATAMALLAMAGPGHAENPRAFGLADYYRTAVVGAPVVSPDGERVAITVGRHELETATAWSEIWMLAPDGSGRRQMTSGRHQDREPRFSADGKRLLFVSDRETDAQQLWSMPVDGGEATRLTSIPTGVASPIVSPDGRFIAVASDVYPECGSDGECNRTLLNSTTSGPLQVHLTDELLYRHWTAWRDGRFTHVLLLDAESGAVVRDLTPGRWDSPTFSVDGVGGFVFSPDGRRLCVVSNHDHVPARSTNSDLWLIEVEAGPGGSHPRNLTAANPGWDGSPVFSPDGSRIAYRSQATPGAESDLFRLAVVDLETGAITHLTDRAKFDNWVDDVRWLPDGRGLLFQAEEKGEQPLYRVDLESGAISKQLTDGSLVGWELMPNGGRVLYTRSRVGNPPELYEVAVDGQREPTRLTHFNAALESEVDIRPAEVMWVPTADGRQIQVFVVTPHGFDPKKSYPLILNVHGGPQSPWKDRYRGDWQVYPGKGYVVAFPNPTGSAGFGQDNVDAISCDWGGRVFDDLMAVTDAIEAKPWIDGDRMGAMGWSWGGYAMMWFEGHTTRFKALASMMGVYDLRSMWGGTEELWFVERDMCGTPWTSAAYDRWSPSRFVERFETPCLVITGERDYRVPYTQSLHFFTDLQVQDIPSRLIVFPNAGHWPSWYEMAFYYLAHVDWFHQWLGGGAPEWDLLSLSRNQVFGTGTKHDTTVE